MGITRHPDHTPKLFFRRTISAQLHAAAFIAALVGIVYLVPLAARAGTAHLWASLIFGVTALMVFATSSTYHFLHDGFRLSERMIYIFESLDHFAIYLFIAGTYTPFLLNAIQGPWRLPLLIAIWSAALAGIFYSGWKHRLPGWAQRRAVYTSVYVLMGWVMFIRIGEVYHNLNQYALAMLVAGGLSYSIGAIVYATKKPKLLAGLFGFHELWHLLVMAGFAFHYFLILSFYYPRFVGG